jgi:diaminohydroxyphosphoribosylaminopyrimidine deaminase/5-amino-6-(5-phosphoribosylamino)uracil reductase
MPRLLRSSSCPTTALSAADDAWMRRALALARRGLGKTIPNPSVGAVLVKNGAVIGSGWHAKAGEPHAEINALHSVGRGVSTKGATLYVTLEPCSTHGRTPPCCAAIVDAQIARVVWGATDPNPAHAGRARSWLEKAGLEVLPGVLATECTNLNREWNHYITTGRPWVILKAGMSLDGRLTAPTTQWITSTAARQDGWKLRHQVDAILIGAETAIRDNPRLTPRGPAPPHSRTVPPWRAVWSPSGKNLPPDLHLLTDSLRDRTLILRQKTLDEALQHLATKGCVSVLLEGGGRLHGAAVDAKLVNEAMVYLAPTFLGGPVAAVRGLGVADHDAALQLHFLSCTPVGSDLRFHALVESTLKPHQSPAHTGKIKN